MGRGTVGEPALRVIRGGRCTEVKYRSVRIVAATPEKPPFGIDAVAFEEDTYLVLSAPPEFHEVNEHPVRILTEAFTMRPAVPGCVIVKGSHPFRLLAIVHDLNEDPTWREEWIKEALEKIFRETEQRRLQSLALPLLGTRFGSLEARRFAQLLRDVLERTQIVYLNKLWLMVSDESHCRILSVFEG